MKIPLKWYDVKGCSAATDSSTTASQCSANSTASSHPTRPHSTSGTISCIYQLKDPSLTNDLDLLLNRSKIVIQN